MCGLREAVSPYILAAQSDLLLGFELAETARSMTRLKPGGAVVVNTQVIKPVSLSLGIGCYDEAALKEYIEKNSGTSLFIDGYGLALAAGSAKAVNIVLLGRGVRARSCCRLTARSWSRRFSSRLHRALWK